LFDKFILVYRKSTKTRHRKPKSKIENPSPSMQLEAYKIADHNQKALEAHQRKLSYWTDEIANAEPSSEADRFSDCHSQLGARHGRNPVWSFSGRW
jgi:hypothetical protein